MPHATDGQMHSYTADNFDDWVRIAGNRFVPLRLSAEPGQEFRGTLRTRYIDDTCVSDMSASAHHVRRVRRDIIASDAPHLKLSLQLEGAGLVTQDGRRARLRPGDLAIYDTSRPYALDYAGPMRSLVIMFPASMLGLAASGVSRITATRLRGDAGMGRVICPFMRRIAEDLDTIEGPNGARIIRSAFDLIAVLLSEEIQAHAGVTTWRATVDRVAGFIDEHLGEPSLSTAAIARAHFMSARQLQYLFREEGTTVSAYIRRRRLERCRADLRDSSLAAVSINQIARRWGLADPSHFSKLFKQAYGCGPREYRLCARDQLPCAHGPVPAHREI